MLRSCYCIFTYDPLLKTMTEKMEISCRSTCVVTIKINPVYHVYAPNRAMRAEKWLIPTADKWAPLFGGLQNFRMITVGLKCRTSHFIKCLTWPFNLRGRGSRSPGHDDPCDLCDVWCHIPENTDSEHVLVQCWASVADDGPTLNQHMFNVPFLLGSSSAWDGVLIPYI